MRLVISAAVSCLIMAGCAGLSGAECRSSDWYQIGQRDGRLGAQPQLDLYAAQCGQNGARPDAARYTEGWQAGFSERPLPSW